MLKFRSKPVEVEAFQWLGEVTDMNKFREFFTDKDGRTAYSMYALNKREDTLIVRTSEGEMLAHSGDWVVKGTKNEFYPVRLDVFEEKYELVEENVSV